MIHEKFTFRAKWLFALQDVRNIFIEVIGLQYKYSFNVFFMHLMYNIYIHIYVYDN